LSEPKKCSPECEFFKCDQKALQRHSSLYCRFADDPCEGPTCKYAACIRNRLLTDGLCGLTFKRTTNFIDSRPEEIVEGVRVKGKLQKRLREREVF